jgi:hypothetical protein
MTRVHARSRVATHARVAIVIAVLATSFVAGSVGAHGPDPTFSGGPMRSSTTLYWRWTGGNFTSAMKGAVKAAATDANGSRASKAPAFAHASGVSSTIYYGPSVPCGVNGLACMRRSTPDWFGVWLRENGHRFDWGTLRWCEMSGSPSGCYQAETITLDELGHVLGLDHHRNFGDDRDYGDAVVQTYSHARPKAGWNADAFARCDVASLQQLYDVPDTYTRYSTCLSVPTTLTMTASSAWVTAGSPVTFTAHLGTNGTGKLSNNKVTGRTVVLQQHLSSGWSDVATMATVSTGTYRTTIAIRSDRDYRARFRRPSNEGLLASSSNVLAVSITGSCGSGGCLALEAPRQ